MTISTPFSLHHHIIILNPAETVCSELAGKLALELLKFDHFNVIAASSISGCQLSSSIYASLSTSAPIFTSFTSSSLSSESSSSSIIELRTSSRFIILSFCFFCFLVSASPGTFFEFSFSFLCFYPSLLRAMPLAVFPMTLLFRRMSNLSAMLVPLVITFDFSAIGMIRFFVFCFRSS